MKTAKKHETCQIKYLLAYDNVTYLTQLRVFTHVLWPGKLAVMLQSQFYFVKWQSGSACMFSVCLDTEFVSCGVFKAHQRSVGPKGGLETDSVSPLCPSHISSTGLTCSCRETTEPSMNTRFNVLPLDEVGVFFMQNKHNVTMLTQ